MRCHLGARKVAPNLLKSPVRVTNLSRLSAGAARLAATPRPAAQSVRQGGGVFPRSPLISPRPAGKWRRLGEHAPERLAPRPHPALRATFSRFAGEGLPLRTPSPSARRRSLRASPGLRSSRASPRGRGRRSSSSCRAGSCPSGSWASAGRPAPA